LVDNEVLLPLSQLVSDLYKNVNAHKW